MHVGQTAILLFDLLHCLCCTHHVYGSDAAQSAPQVIECACVEGQGRFPKGVGTQLANAQFHRGEWERMCVGEGGSPKGLVRNLLMQSFTSAPEKSNIPKLTFLILWPHKMTIEPCKACSWQHLCVFHLILVLGVHVGGGVVSQGIGTQCANAVLQRRRLKNLMFRNLFFAHRDHTK